MSSPAPAWVAYAAIAISFVALVWPGVLWAFRQIFHKGTLEVFLSGDAQLGLTSQGPALILPGTVRALNRDMFVERVDAELTRVRDGATHTFAWLLFVPDLPGQGQSFRCRGFAVPVNAAEPFNIMLTDAVTAADVTNLLQPLTAAWRTTLQVGEAFADGAQVETNLASLRKSFLESTEAIDAHAALSRLDYWNAGTYRLVLNVHSPKAGRFAATTFFDLSPEDEKFLRLNVVAILNEAIGDIELVSYNWRTVTLKSGPADSSGGS